ncbi:MFS transporter [Bowmanella dokdonensis]|uniref:MFS transporter n=1 Tax=Bowmanella dokdonensis TaxID=751969 RepID=A0A939ISJ8_9ALTE|nr:MFS transporter [Bowmanella dokdonensis]MBN7826802.1 MFS transporter [Bowmanella dokdonensis]
MKQIPGAHSLYQIVEGEDEARACKDLPDDVCRQVPGNFLAICASLVLTKLGDLCASPKIVLTWLLGAIGAPAALISLLVPIRESGSLIPQLAIGAWVRRHPKRKGFWLLGSAIQGSCVISMALAIWMLPGTQAGVTVVVLLALFSLARGLCSVTVKDIQGKTIPKRRRGRLSGIASTVAGIITAAISLAFFAGQEDPTVTFYNLLLLFAGLLWLFAAVIFMLVEEQPGETSGGRNALSEGIKNLSLLKTDTEFRHFVLSRALLMGSALSAPFILLLAQQKDSDPATFGAFLLASSLGASLSASIWGFLADDSSRKVMLRGGLIAALCCLGLFTVEIFTPFQQSWLYALFYFVLSVAHSGVRIGRQTYLVDMAGGVKRTDYVSVSNSVIGVLLLTMGGITAAIATWSVPTVVLFLGLMGLSGALCTWRMKEVES